MLIRTQSKEAMADVVHIYLSEMMGEKQYYIFGTCSMGGVFAGNRITLGIYKSKKEALHELDDIERYFSDNPNGIYKMK